MCVWWLCQPVRECAMILFLLNELVEKKKEYIVILSFTSNTTHRHAVLRIRFVVCIYVFMCVCVSTCAYISTQVYEHTHIFCVPL